MGHTCDMARGDHQMRIRLPGDLLERIQTEAKSGGRSLNAEIVARLQESVAAQDAVMAGYASTPSYGTWMKLLAEVQRAVQRVEQSGTSKFEIVLTAVPVADPGEG